MEKKTATILIAMAIIVIFNTISPAIDIEWVTVGHPNNIADTEIMSDHTTGYGSVAYGYKIGKYEVMNGQYIEFLNAVASVEDTHGLYNPEMSGTYGGIDQTGPLRSYRYSPKDGDLKWLTRPVNFVSFYNTLRFANWLHNGKPNGLQNDDTTENGAYDMSLNENVTRKIDAKFFLPSEDEWYKAAYYDPNESGVPLYWDYATQSNTAPTSEVPPGIYTVNGSANYENVIGGYIGVGAYTYKPSTSAYGTFDQNGNVKEWIEEQFGPWRGFRGGSWEDTSEALHAYHRYATYTEPRRHTGFRIACIGPFIISPNGDENLISGQEETISWDSTGKASHVAIEYSDNNGVDWNIIDPCTPNDGEYVWEVPSVTSDECYIRISDITSSNIYDTSDNKFTIFGCHNPPPGDLNNDCYINLIDVALMAQNMLWTGNPYDENYQNPVGLVFIPGSEFNMGDHTSSEGDPDELPRHPVYIDSFHMSTFEISNQQYCNFLNSSINSNDIKVEEGIVYASSDTSSSYPYCDTHSYDPSSQIDFTDTDFSVRTKDGRDMSDDPMVEVSWYGAVAYCNWRSSQEEYESCYNLSTWECGFSKKGYRLATEAEWEYAARGGNHSPYYRYPCSDSIEGYQGNYALSGDPYETGDYPWTTPVGYYNGSQIPSGTDMANGYGLYDMAGNVWEWCNDWYDYSYYSICQYDNPTGPASGSCRLIRGGGWEIGDERCRIAFRNIFEPYDRNSENGFRIVLDLD